MIIGISFDLAKSSNKRLFYKLVDLIKEEYDDEIKAFVKDETYESPHKVEVGKIKGTTENNDQIIEFEKVPDIKQDVDRKPNLYPKTQERLQFLVDTIKQFPGILTGALLEKFNDRYGITYENAQNYLAKLKSMKLVEHTIIKVKTGMYNGSRTTEWFPKKEDQPSVPGDGSIKSMIKEGKVSMTIREDVKKPSDSKLYKVDDKIVKYNRTKHGREKPHEGLRLKEEPEKESIDYEGQEDD